MAFDAKVYRLDPSGGYDDSTCVKRISKGEAQISWRQKRRLFGESKTTGNPNKNEKKGSIEL